MPKAMRQLLSGRFTIRIQIIMVVLMALCYAPQLLLASASSVESTADNAFIATLTAEEKAWVDSQHSLKMVYDPDWAPFEWKSPEGEHTGIVADIINVIRLKTGLNIQVVDTSTWADSVSLVKSGEADFFSAITVTNEREQYLDFSNNDIYTYPAVLLTKFADQAIYLDAQYDLKDKKIGVVKSSGLGSYIKQQYPSLNFVEVDSTESGFKQLTDDKIDLFAINSVTARYYIEKKNFDNIKVALKLDYIYSLKIAARKTLPKEAISILNKALGSITNDEISRTVSKWIEVPPQHTTDWETTIKISIALLVIIGIALWNSRVLASKVREKTAELESKNRLLKQSIEEIERLKQKEKEDIYYATVQGSQHILNNLLNQLLLVKMEIKKHPDFNKKISEQFNQMQHQAKELTIKLSSVENIDKEEIKKSVYPK